MSLAKEGFPWAKISAAKKLIYSYKPWWSSFLEAMPVVPIDVSAPLGELYGATTSTDRDRRLYVDGSFARNATLELLAGSIERELQRQVRDIWNRFSWLSEDQWNEHVSICLELEINSSINAENTSSLKQNTSIFTSDMTLKWNTAGPPALGDFGWQPQLVDMPERLSAEEYYDILTRIDPEPPPKGDEEEEDDSPELERVADDEERSDTGFDSEPFGDGNSDGDEDASESGDGVGEPSDSSDSSGDESSDSESGDGSGEKSDSGPPEDLEDSGDSGDSGEPSSDEDSESDGASGDKSNSSDSGEGGEDSGDGSGEDDSEGEPPEMKDGASSGDGDPLGGGSSSNSTGSSEGKPTDKRNPLQKIQDLLNESTPHSWQANDFKDPKVSHNENWKPDEESETPALTELEKNKMDMELAKDIRKNAPDWDTDEKFMTVTGWADDLIRSNPGNWERIFRRVVSTSVESARINGSSDLSYSVRNPNQQSIGPVLMGLHDYSPSIYVVQDVSGSMTMNKGMQSSIRAFEQITKKVLGKFGERVTWVTVDTSVKSVGRGSKVDENLIQKWSYGFGGTDIGKVLRDLERGTFAFKGKRHKRPDLIILNTDCGFDWPWLDLDKAPNGLKFVLCSTVRRSELYVNIPPWLRDDKEFIYIGDDDDSLS